MSINKIIRIEDTTAPCLLPLTAAFSPSRRRRVDETENRLPFGNWNTGFLFLSISVFLSLCDCFFHNGFVANRPIDMHCLRDLWSLP